MLTNNFYRILSANVGAASAYSEPIVKSDGSTVAEYFYASYSPQLLSGNAYVSSATFSSNGIVFGRGTAPATRQDYKLEDQITSGLTQLSTSSVTCGGDGFYEHITTINMKNETDADITISEIGKVGQARSGSTSSSIYRVLVERTVLDNPITIPPGEARAITYTVRLTW